MTFGSACRKNKGKIVKTLDLHLQDKGIPLIKDTNRTSEINK